MLYKNFSFPDYFTRKDIRAEVECERVTGRLVLAVEEVKLIKTLVSDTWIGECDQYQERGLLNGST
jgi:hypothetical protein